MKRILYLFRGYIAVLLLAIGFTPKTSRFLDMDIKTAGYGKENQFGYFRFDLPKKYL